MSKIKKKKFAIISLLLVVLCGLMYCLPTFVNAKSALETTNSVRTIEVEQNKINIQSVFEEFEDAKLETEGSITTFKEPKQ